MNLWSKVGSGLKRFRMDRRGGVAVTFALCFTPVAFLSLVMIDFSRASTARSALQETLDASTLIAARSSAITADDVDKIGDAAMKAQLPTNLGIGSMTADTSTRIANATFAPVGTTITGTATATYTPIVASLFIGGPMNIAAKSEVVRSVNKLEIALVLDTTGSMSGTKIANLITAADSFVDTMKTAAAKSSEVDPVKISVVPFSTTVKVSAPVSLSGYASYKATNLPTWLDGSSRATTWDKDVFTVGASSDVRTDRFALLKSMGQSWGGCVEARQGIYDTTDDAPATTNAALQGVLEKNLNLAQAQSMFTPFFWPDEPDTYSGTSGWGTFKNNYLADNLSNTVLNAMKAILNTATGYLKAQGYVAKYSSTSVKSGAWSQGSGYGADLTYGPNAGCAMQQMKRLSTDFTSIKTTIDGLIASGETNIPIGLAWGWHTLSPNAPLADGVAYGTPKTTKIIVLMTDGANTMNDSGNLNDSWYHGYGYLWQNKLGTTATGSVTAALDTRMKSLCTNIKAKNIVIYTVGVGVNSDSQTLLTNCATTPGQYYDVNSSGTNMNAAFSAIAGSIENLRISK
jgi:Flp pilus assembly protein TadG